MSLRRTSNAGSTAWRRRVAIKNPGAATSAIHRAFIRCLHDFRITPDKRFSNLCQFQHEVFGRSDSRCHALRFGLHAKGWSRQDVLDYMYANSAVKPAKAISEAERYMAIPGQALAYKVGQLKIRELRDISEEHLGDAFYAKAFHLEVLKDGPMPLSMLQSKVERWIDAQL